MTPCCHCLVAGMYASQNSVIAGLVMLSMLDIALICQLGVTLSPPPKAGQQRRRTDGQLRVIPL